MKINLFPSRRRGFLQLDLVVGVAILSIAVMPLAFSFVRERQALRVEYFRSVINEVVDGEMEILAAGAARNLPDGLQKVSPPSPAVRLPDGHYQLTKSGNHLRLEWLPDEKCGFGAIIRETNLK